MTDVSLAEYSCLFRASGPSVLLIGAEPDTDRAIQLITATAVDAIAAWPDADGQPLSAAAALTVVVRNVESFDALEQGRLHRWLGERPGGIRVIATSPVPLYGLVARQLFLEPLYYRLNVVCLEAAALVSAAI